VSRIGLSRVEPFIPVISKDDASRFRPWILRIFMVNALLTAEHARIGPSRYGEQSLLPSAATTFWSAVLHSRPIVAGGVALTSATSARPNPKRWPTSITAGANASVPTKVAEAIRLVRSVSFSTLVYRVEPSVERQSNADANGDPSGNMVFPPLTCAHPAEIALLTRQAFPTRSRESLTTVVVTVRDFAPPSTRFDASTSTP